jgi:hypothetical protein
LPGSMADCVSVRAYREFEAGELTPSIDTSRRIYRLCGTFVGWAAGEQARTVQPAPAVGSASKSLEMRRAKRCVGPITVGLREIDRAVSVVPGIENRAISAQDGRQHSRVLGHLRLESIGFRNGHLFTSLLGQDNLTQVLGR